jgi:hypothetical protein
MAALNYYLGLKRGASNNPGNVVSGTTSGGTAADVEVRMQINNGSSGTGLTRKDVILLLEQIEEFIEQGGITGQAGANLPAL